MLNEIYQNLDPVAFAIGPLSVRWYGIAYVAGFLFSALIIWRLAKRWKLNFDEDALLTIVCCIVVGVILGARLGYCLVYGNVNYLEQPLELLAFNHGGMSFHGGLVGAVIGGIVASRLVHMPFASLADMCAIAAPVGLFFGRCANFVNGELWGAVTDLPWGVVFGGTAGSLPRHPSQLYEALLEGVLLFCLLIVLSRKVPPRPRGTFIGVFLLFYGVARFLIEFVRQPDAHIGYLYGGWLTMGQVLSVPLIVIGIIVVVVAHKRNLPQEGISRE